DLKNSVSRRIPISPEYLWTGELNFFFKVLEVDPRLLWGWVDGGTDQLIEPTLVRVQLNETDLQVFMVAFKDGKIVPADFAQSFDAVFVFEILREEKPKNTANTENISQTS